MLAINDNKATDIAERMARTIYAEYLWDLYDPIENEDSIEGIKDALKTSPYKVIEFLLDYIEDGE